MRSLELAPEKRALASFRIGRERSAMVRLPGVRNQPSVIHSQNLNDCNRCKTAQVKARSAMLKDSEKRFQALATGISSQRVVYPGVRLSCFIAQTRLSPASPALAISKVPLP